MDTGKKEKRWERTNTANLWKLVSTGGYYARVKVNGTEKWKSLKTKLSSVAKLRLADFERAERQRAKAPEKTIEIDGQTGGHFLDYYLAGAKLRDRASSTTERVGTAAMALEETWPEFRGLNVRNITVLQCREWALRAKAKGTGFVAPGAKCAPRPMSASAFNKALAVLRDTLEVAAKAGLIYSNPAMDVERMPPKKKELILPSREQFRAIIDHIRSAPARFAGQGADMVEFLAYSGARIGECRAAIWADLDEERNLMRIHGYQDRIKRSVDTAFPQPQGAPTGHPGAKKNSQPEEKIFATRECADALTAACKKAGVSKMSHHDLRHLFATWCIEAGVDIPTVSRWLGHADGGALAMRTYGHLRQAHSQAQAAKVTW